MEHDTHRNVTELDFQELERLQVTETIDTLLRGLPGARLDMRIHLVLAPLLLAYDLGECIRFSFAGLASACDNLLLHENT